MSELVSDSLAKALHDYDEWSLRRAELSKREDEGDPSVAREWPDSDDDGIRCLEWVAEIVKETNVVGLLRLIEHIDGIVAGDDDPWASDPDFPVYDWQHEVACDNTRRGYWAWVAARREEAE